MYFFFYTLSIKLAHVMHFSKFQLIIKFILIIFKVTVCDRFLSVYVTRRY